MKGNLKSDFFVVLGFGVAYLIVGVLYGIGIGGGKQRHHRFCFLLLRGAQLHSGVDCRNVLRAEQTRLVGTRALGHFKRGRQMTVARDKCPNCKS